jgi:hypothetical protein
VDAASSHRTRARRDRFDLWRTGILPLLLVGALSGLLGIYWDIAWHIDIGRDTLFTPPHNFIYGAMLITLVVGIGGLIRDRRAGPLHLPVGRWRLHPGLLIVVVGAGLELFFAPADELWHRLFGVDVTLWAPMHLVGVLGLTLLSFGGLVTVWVERRLSADPARRRLFGRLALVFGAALLGWLMLLLAEFEFGVPAFPTLWHPLLLIGLPGFALTLMARLRPVPIGASQLDLAGWTRPMIPLLIVAGLAADLLVRRSLPAPLLGLLLAAVLFASNWPLAWVGSPNWHPAALAWGLPFGLLLSVVSCWLGLIVADALGPDRGVGPEGVAA